MTSEMTEADRMGVMQRLAARFEIDDTTLAAVRAQPNGDANFARVMVALDQLLGSDVTNTEFARPRQWLNLVNTVLGGRPVDVMRTDIKRVAGYLESRTSLGR